MLFGEKNNLDLFFALGGTLILLTIAVRPAMAEIGQPVGLLLAVLVTFPTVANLLRYKKAPIGCAVVPLGFLLWLVAWQLGRNWTERAMVLGAPNLLLFLHQFWWLPWRAEQAARHALLELAGAPGPSQEASFLLYPADAVRHAAADALGKRALDEVLPEVEAHLRGEDPDARRQAFRALGLLAERELSEVSERLGALASDPHTGCAADAARTLASVAPSKASEHAEDPRPEVRLALSEGLRSRTPPSSELAARLIVQVAGGAEVPADLRLAALELSDPPSEASASVWSESLRAALRSDAVDWEAATSEVLWILCEHGEGPDVPCAARSAGSEDYAVANAAMEAVEGILNRGESQGEARTETIRLLRAAVQSLRAVHPEGENRLADMLVARSEDAAAGLEGQ